jgi:hypothetical protein
MKINGSTALVTGANRGLGRAFVQALQDAGCTKIYSAARTIEGAACDAVVEPVQLDITKIGQVSSAATRSIGRGTIQKCRVSEHFYTDCWFQQAQAPRRRQLRRSYQEAVMRDADLFRQYAAEAIRGSSKATDENEKRSLVDLACTWAQAALLSERVLGSSFIASSPDVGDSGHATSGPVLICIKATSVSATDAFYGVERVLDLARSYGHDVLP